MDARVVLFKPPLCNELVLLVRLARSQSITQRSITLCSASLTGAAAPMLALAILTPGRQLQPLCAMENRFINNALHANHDPPATSERATAPAVLCNVAAQSGAQHIPSLSSFSCSHSAMCRQSGPDDQDLQ